MLFISNMLKMTTDVFNKTLFIWIQNAVGLFHVSVFWFVLSVHQWGCLLELCSPAWSLAPGAHPVNIWLSSALVKWAWRAALWPRTNARVPCTSSRQTTRSSTSAGRTGPLGMWRMWGLFAVSGQALVLYISITMFWFCISGSDNIPGWLWVQAGQSVHYRTSVCAEVQGWL